MIIISEDEQEGKKGKHTAPHTHTAFFLQNRKKGP
jgi:hypothetical protein